MTAMLDSLRPADSARSAETTQHRRPTSKDILAGGYNCQREIPEPVECEFCGRKLYHEALVMGRTVLMFAPFPQRCTCEQAKAKWAEADAEEARQKAEAEKEAAQAKRRAKIERLLGRSGIKKRFQQRTFANFIRDTPERRRCYDTAKTYADSFPQRAERGEGLYIEGTYKSFVTKQTTYCNALRQWAKRETDPNVIGSIYYGCALPEDLEKEVGDILSAAQAQITAIINKLSA